MLITGKAERAFGAKSLRRIFKLQDYATIAINLLAQEARAKLRQSPVEENAGGLRGGDRRWRNKRSITCELHRAGDEADLVVATLYRSFHFDFISQVENNSLRCLDRNPPRTVL